MEYEAVIGLEVHAELSTDSKLFCGCSTKFGAEPNTQTCPVCLGLPGVLPVLNRRAFEYVLRAALALACEVRPRTHMDRKNYYYPDLPKNYQISQNYANLGINGFLEIPLDGQLKKVGILNVHLEEDAGKLLHGEGYTLVDLNRAGVPLIEIVSAPDLRSVDEVESYMQTLRNTLLYLGISDCKMQEGQLRFEASVSVRPKGQAKLGSRVEIKNLNSITFCLRAVAYEIQRQTRVVEQGGKIDQETRLYDEEAGRTARMRSKEEAHDYRYFPEPDLVPIDITAEMIAEQRWRIPELPVRRARRFVEQYGLSDYDAGVLTADQTLADLYEDVVREGVQPKAAANWLTNQLLAQLDERGKSVADANLRASHIAKLIAMTEASRSGTNKKDILQLSTSPITASTSIVVFDWMMKTGEDPEKIVREKGLAQISDAGELDAIIDKVLAENAKTVADYRAGNAKAFNALIGPIMRETKGKANPAAVRELLQQKLGGGS